MIKDWPIVIAGSLAFVASMIAVVLSMLRVVNLYDAKGFVAVCWGCVLLVVLFRSRKAQGS